MHLYHHREESIAPSCPNTMSQQLCPRWNKHRKASTTCAPKLVLWLTSLLLTHTDKEKKIIRKIPHQPSDSLVSDGQQPHHHPLVDTSSPILTPTISHHSPSECPNPSHPQQTRGHPSAASHVLHAVRNPRWPVLKVSLISSPHPTGISNSLCYDRTWPLAVAWL